MMRAGETTSIWQRGWFWILLALLSALPIIIAPIPMMPDFFSHMGRYHVMNHGAGSPFLMRYYAFRWALIGNMGVDLLMVPLGWLLPTEMAARMAAALIPPLTVAGIHAVSRAAWGRIEAPALLALPFVYSFSFLYGFVNYHLALALALLVLALWMRRPALPMPARWLVFAPLAIIVWAAHMAGWAVLVVAVAGHEVVASHRTATVPMVRGLVQAGLRLLPLLVPLVLVLAWRSGGGETAAMPEWGYKLFWVSVLLRAEWRVFDLASLGLLLVMAMVLLRERSPRAFGLLLAASALFLCFLALPNSIFGSFYADQRLLVPMMILFFLGFAVQDRRRANLVAGIAIALFGVRIAETTIGWQDRGRAADADLQALDQVPRGARIAVASPPTDCGGWPLAGYETLPSLAIVRREAFVDTQWDMAGAQLMRPIYNLGHGYNDEHDIVLRAPGCAAGRPLPDLLAGLPRDRFDYVWVFGDDQPHVDWLEIRYRGPHGRLYRIVR